MIILKRQLAILIAALAIACNALAQTGAYPTRPVRLLIPFVPGGSTDFVARIMQPRMVEELGQQIIIDNRAGASGNIAVELVARAPADGYTVLFGNVGTITINPILFRDFPVDTVRDLQCVSVVADVSALMILNAGIPVSGFQEFIRYAKERPGQMNFASSGAGSNSRLTMEYIMDRTGTQLAHIAYNGGSGVIAAVLSGETQVGFAPTPSGIPLMRSGRLKGLALLAASRTASLPEVPTLTELGFPELKVSSWQALYVPAKTPAAAVAKLRRAVVRAMNDPRVVESFKTGGAGPMEPALFENCTAFTRQQVQFWAQLVRKVGLAGKQ
jgi:tripartite-type tricarboxylate transporter receptor subunit TctC